MGKLFLFCLLCLIACVANAQEIADYVVVEKSKHNLTLFKNGKSMGVFHVVFGGNPSGHKEREGDNKTPEGIYTLDGKNANSGYFKAIHISYPNADDVARAKSKGVPAGGAVMIHGHKNGFGWASFATQRINWTAGCVALNDSDMDRV